MLQTNNDDIALLGGTFDPIHYGHIQPAKQVADWLGLKQVLLLPAHIPVHKAHPGTSARQRAAMIDLVCQDQALLAIDRRELNRATPSYTVETLQQIKQQSPNKRIFFIVGMDSLLSFTTWHKWQDILGLCHLVVNTRPGYDLQRLPEQTRQLLQKHQQNDLTKLTDQSAGAIIFSPPANYDISSTQLRQQLKNRHKYNSPELSLQVPDKVLAYINNQHLYL